MENISPGVSLVTAAQDPLCTNGADTVMAEDAFAPFLGRSTASALNPAPPLKPLPRRLVSMRPAGNWAQGGESSKQSHVCLAEAKGPQGSVSSDVKASRNKRSSSGCL